jgi:hypothetical protein
MIHEQLAAAWAGIEPQDIAFLRENADLRIVVNGIGDFSGNPTQLADDFGRAVELASANVIAAPCIFRVRLAIIYQPAIFIHIDLLAQCQVDLLGPSFP